MYSSGTNYCGTSAATSCLDVVPALGAVPETPIVLHVLALFPPGAEPRLSAVGFGLDYDANFSVTASGSCGDFTVPDAAWPESGSGTALSWTQSQTAMVVEAYWLAGYAYAATVVELTPHPSHGAWFADDSVPSLLDPIAELGAFGIGVAGLAPCPGTQEDGPMGGGSEDGPTGGDSDEGEQDDPFPPEDDSGPLGDGDVPEDPGDSGDEPAPSITGTPLDRVTISVPPDALLYETTSSAAFAPAEADFLVPALRTELAAAGVVTVEKAVPWRTSADTLALDRWGRTVRIPDVSRYFVLELGDAATATTAEASLRQSSRISTAFQDYAYPVANPYPDDPEFQASGDPQWYLNNTGARGTAGADLNIYGGYWPWEIVPGGKTFRIGLIDVGVIDEHEDLTIHPPAGSPHREYLSAHPDHEPCGNHGTAVAGVAAARTNNAKGVAGVCSTCEVLDLEMCGDLGACLADTCSSVTFDEDVFAYALDHYGDPGFDVLLYEAGGGRYLTPIQQNLLYDAYARGIVTFAPAANGKVDLPNGFPALAGFPIVVGVGGFTIEGGFWGADACASPGEDGDGSALGSGAVDIAGPACSGEFGAPTTNFTGSDVYRWTRMMNSGATAAVAGAATLAQTIQENLRAGWGELSAGEYAAAVVNAARPFVDMEDLPASYGCGTIEDFGHGILDVNLLVDLTLLMGGHPQRMYTHVVRHGDEGAIFEAVSPPLPSSGPQKWYRLWRLSQTSFVPITGWGESAVQYIAWPNHTESHDGVVTTTPLWHQSTQYEDYPSRQGWMNHMAQAGLTACELSIPEPRTGQVTLTGYNIELLKDDGVTHLAWMFEPESLVMSYSYYTELAPAELAEPRTTDDPPLTLIVENSPGRGPMRFRSHGTFGPEVTIEVFDAAGRLVWSQPWSEIATSDGVALWPSEDRSGRPLPSGLYWGRLRSPYSSSTNKIVLVR